MAEESVSCGIKNFDCHSDPSTVGLRWSRWISSFTYYADGKGLLIEEIPAGASEAQRLAQLRTRQRRRALLLHLAGPEVQDIFATLHDTGESDEYDKAVEALKNYFVPKVNTTFSRQLFQNAEPNDNETIQQFSTRLRKLALDCNYGTDTDNQIRDSILWKCKSPYIKRRLLEEGEGLTLEKTITLASQLEKIENQMQTKMINENENGNSVNKVDNSKYASKNKRGKKNEFKPKTEPKKEPTCYRCGYSGHFGKDPKCPARGKQCSKCGKMDHYSKVCNTKQVRMVECDEERSNNDPEYVFTVGDIKSAVVPLEVGNVPLNMIVDSGAS